MKYLIVNADDFGLTAGVNRAIIDGYTDGIITSATVMVNMPGFDDAVRLAGENPGLGIGLHFNITEGRPVSEGCSVKSLINEAGEFLGNSTALTKRAVMGRLKRKEVEIELQAQIDKARPAGIDLTHIDSHKHSHALPIVFQAVLRLAESNSIKSVRWPAETPAFRGVDRSPATILQATGALALGLVCRISRSKMMRSGLNIPDAFFGVTQTGIWTREWLLALIKGIPDGTSELMTHPGYVDRELLSTGSRLADSRTIEIELLRDPEVRQTIVNSGIELIGFSELEARQRSPDPHF